MAVLGGVDHPLSHLAVLFETASALGIQRVLLAFCGLERSLLHASLAATALPESSEGRMVISDPDEHDIFSAEENLRTAQRYLGNLLGLFKQSVAAFAAGRIQSVWRARAPRCRVLRDCRCDCARPDSALCSDCGFCLACGACQCDIGYHIHQEDVAAAEVAAAGAILGPARLEDAVVSQVRRYIPFFERGFRWHWKHHARIRHFKTFLVDHLSLGLTWERLRSDTFMGLWDDLRAMD